MTGNMIELTEAKSHISARPIMQFFVRDWPGFYLDDEKFEAAKSAYEKHCTAILDRIPGSLQRLLNSSCYSEPLEALIEKWSRAGDTLEIVTVADDELRASITYTGVSNVTVNLGGELDRWVDNPHTKIIYSELDVLENGTFQHRLALWPRGEIVVTFANAELSIDNVEGDARGRRSRGEWNPERAAEELELMCALLESDNEERREEGWGIGLSLINGRPENVELVLPHLRRFYAVESSPELIADALYALAYTGVKDVLGLILEHEDAELDRLRLAVAQTITSVWDDPPTALQLDALARLSSDRDRDVRNWATFAIAQLNELDTPRIRNVLAERLSDEHSDTFAEAVVGLARRKDPRVIKPMLEHLKSDNVGRLVVNAARHVANPQLLPALKNLREWWDVDVEMLEDAIRLCDPVEQERERQQIAEFRALIEKRLGKLEGVEIKEVKVARAAFELDIEVEVLWVGPDGATRMTGQWAMEYLLKSVGGDLDAAAYRVAESVGEDVEKRGNTATYTINAGNFSTLEGFYDEVSFALIPGASWGRNLDAFDDILSGGFGTPDDGGFTIRWVNHQTSKRCLGHAETVRQLEQRLERCHPSNRDSVAAQLREAKAGKGETVFDWLVEIIRSHGRGGDQADDGVRLELV